MANEDWKLQVSYKTSTGDMINVRANTADELSVLLEGVSDYSTQIAATARMLNASAVVSPLATTTSTTAIAQESTFAPFQAQAPSATGPTCTHWARKFLSGVSKKNGKPYAMWVCPQPQGADQCSPVNG